MNLCETCGAEILGCRHRFCPSCAKKRVKAHMKAYYQKPEVKVRMKAYNQKPEVKAYKKAYNQKPEVKVRMKAYVPLACFVNDFFRHFSGKFRSQDDFQKTADYFAENACGLSHRNKCALKEKIYNQYVIRGAKG